MARINSTKKKQKILGNKSFIIIGLVVLVFLSIALGKELLRRYEINQEIDQLKSEISELEQTNLDLDEMIGYLNTNSFTEKEARTKLGLQKPGETMVIINQKSTNQTNQLEEEQLTSEKSSNPEMWWNYFFASKE